jgi:hypothetical protein
MDLLLGLIQEKFKITSLGFAARLSVLGNLTEGFGKMERCYWERKRF